MFIGLDSTNEFLNRFLTNPFNGSVNWNVDFGVTPKPCGMPLKPLISAKIRHRQSLLSDLEIKRY